MQRAKQYWKRIPAPVRKTLVLIAGSTVILTGLALIVLPGPGWVIIFLGFTILATEFTVAEKARDWLITEVKRLARRLKQVLNRSK